VDQDEDLCSVDRPYFTEKAAITPNSTQDAIADFNFLIESASIFLQH
jgi:hypothetical protein